MESGQDRQTVSGQPKERQRDSLGEKLASDMTIREKFAAMVLQGLMANPNDIPQIAGKTDPNNPAGQLAQVSLKIADALLKELEKKTK